MFYFIDYLEKIGSVKMAGKAVFQTSLIYFRFRAIRLKETQDGSKQ
jgi:hypothetical protein